jgi:hypothetical protein
MKKASVEAVADETAALHLFHRDEDRPMKKASARSVRDEASALHLFHRDEIRRAP